MQMQPLNLHANNCRARKLSPTPQTSNIETLKENLKCRQVLHAHTSPKIHLGKQNKQTP